MNRACVAFGSVSREASRTVSSRTASPPSKCAPGFPATETNARFAFPATPRIACVNVSIPNAVSSLSLKSNCVRVSAQLPGRSAAAIVAASSSRRRRRRSEQKRRSFFRVWSFDSSGSPGTDKGRHAFFNSITSAFRLFFFNTSSSSFNASRVTFELFPSVTSQTPPCIRAARFKSQTPAYPTSFDRRWITVRNGDGVL